MDLNIQKSQEIKARKKGLLLKLLKPFTIIKNKANTVAIGNTNEELEILESIKRAQEEWADANRNFEYADDDEIIDYYTYKIKASEIRYDYFIKKAKEMGIKAEARERTGLPVPGSVPNNCN